MSRLQIALPPADPPDAPRPPRPDGQCEDDVEPVLVPRASNDVAPLALTRPSRSRLLLPMTIVLAAAIGSIVILKAKGPRDSPSPSTGEKPPYSLTGAWRGIGQRAAREIVHPGVQRIEDIEGTARESNPEPSVVTVGAERGAPLPQVERHLSQLALESVAALPKLDALGGQPASDNPAMDTAVDVARIDPMADAAPANAEQAPHASPAIETSEAVPRQIDRQETAAQSTDQGSPIDEPMHGRIVDTASSATSVIPPLPRRKPTFLAQQAPPEAQERHQPARPLRKATQLSKPPVGAVGSANVFRDLDYSMP